MQTYIEIVSKIGVYGLVIVMAAEGASLPFPGIIIILTLGYLLKLTLARISIVSAIMSLSYCAFSFIPYTIGFKLENLIRKKYKKQIEMTQNYFHKYGEYSIAILRPFAAGNYISYFAGMSRINPYKYTVLTFAGIYPWSFAMLFLGGISNGNVNSVIILIQSYLNYLYFFIFVFALTFLLGILFHNLLCKSE